jgi:hypothetical protein
MPSYMTGKATVNVATAQVPANQLKLDVDPRIKHHEWALDVGAVLFAIQGRGGIKKKSTSSVQFKQWEKEAFGRWCYLSAQLNAAASQMSVDDGAGAAGYNHLKAGDVCMLVSADMATRELILVTATPTSGTVAISKNFGSSGDSTWVDNTAIYKLYNCGIERSTTPDIKSVIPTEVPNYCAEIRTPMGGSRRAIKSEYYTGKKLSELRLEAWIEHLKDLSGMLLWGESKAETTYGRTQPQGLWDAIVSRNGYTKNVNGNLTIQVLQEIMRNVFKKGSTNKIALCAPLLIDAFAYFKKESLIMKPSEEWFNMKVGDFETGQGHLTLIRARQLEGDPTAPDGMFGSSMIIFDEEYVSYRYFADDDTHLITNTQNNDDFGQQDEYLTDGGIQVDVGPAHGAAYNITGYA